MFSIGYDLGSSSVKAVLYNIISKQSIASATYPETEMKIETPQENWAEQNPNDWWNNIKKVTDVLFDKIQVARSEVVSIGIAYQMHGLVCLDANGKVLRPAIIWCDSRAVTIGNSAFKTIGEQKCLEHLLNSPGNFTASKLAWVKQNEPEVYKNIAKVMLPGDYIAYRFTNSISTTNTGLSEGVLWDFKKEELSNTVLDCFDFDQTIFPKTTAVFANQGGITSEIIKEFGFNKKAIVSYRAGDQPNNAFSLNVLEPGEIAATGGTSGVVYGVSDVLRYDKHQRVNTFLHVNHSATHKRLGVLLCINGTGSAYAWLRNQLSPNSTYFDLETLANKVSIGAEGLSFLPFGNGAERMLANKVIGAHFSELQFSVHTLSHLTRACLEGIAFSFVYGIEAMHSLGIMPKTIKVGNDNMFQSSVFATTIATLTGARIIMLDSSGAYGSAVGAAYGANKISDIKTAFSHQKVIKEYTADVLNIEAYQKAYENWKNNLERKK